MRATLEDIARQAGVSAMTASNVLRNRHAKASEKTRRQVFEAASKLRYIPIQAGRQNSHVKTGMIGLVERHFDAVVHPIAPVTLSGMQAGAAEFGYDLALLLRPQPSWIMDADEATFLDRRVDGFVIRSSQDIDYMADAIAGAHMPCVACYTDSPPPGVGSVTIDNELAIRDAVAYLVARGHRRVGHITGGNHPDGIARVAAFRKCVADFGLHTDERLVVEGHWGAREEAKGIDAMLASCATAVVCGNDYQAWQLWDAATQAGIDVPGDLSLIGIDDIDESRYRGLTTFASPFLEIGRAAVEMLVEKIDKREVGSTTRKIPATLIERRSVASPRSATRTHE